MALPTRVDCFRSGCFAAGHVLQCANMGHFCPAQMLLDKEEAEKEADNGAGTEVSTDNA